MSGQMTLFKVEKKVEEKPEVDVITIKKKSKKEEVSDVIEHTITEKDKYGWKQLPNNEEKKNIGMDYTHIQLSSQSDLNGIKYRASFSEAHENPHDMLGSSWGGGGSFNPNDLDEIQQAFNIIMKHKKNDIEEPYRAFTDAEIKVAYEHHNAYYYFRLVPAKNYFIIIADELVAMLKKTGFDLEAWYKEYQELPEKTATEQDWNNILELLQWLEKGHKVNNKLDIIQPVLEMKNIDELKNTKQEVKGYFEKYLLQLKEINDNIVKLGGYDEYSYDIKRYQETINKCWW